MANNYELKNVTDPHSVVTAIPSSETFPEFLQGRIDKYDSEINLFTKLVNESDSTAQLLEKIRTPKAYPPKLRMSLLKIFRRCVSTIIDTEAAKKIGTENSVFVDNYGDTFKDISILRHQFNNLSDVEKSALIALIGEYDNRGQQGYVLTRLFFEWVESAFEGVLTIEGPRGAGKDPQLSEIFSEFEGDFPCDFILRKVETNEPIAIGLARYDSTRGGAQSDDRTGGNSDKVNKAMKFCAETGNKFKLIFLSDGPGLTHKDTWQESLTLDGQWGGNVRVATLKSAPERLTLDWLLS